MQYGAVCFAGVIHIILFCAHLLLLKSDCKSEENNTYVCLMFG